MNAQILPAGFRDDLGVRAVNIRFRNVGNPYQFLDEIGIIPIKEYLFRGANIIDIADILNLPLTIIHNWIAENGYGPEIEEASVISAEGYIYQGEKLLKAANNKFDLDKAKALLEHGRFMASKKNKKLYGQEKDVGAGPAAVNYIFNIGQAPQQRLDTIPREAADILDAEYHVAPTSRTSLQLTEDGILQTPEGLVVHDDTMEVLGAKPTYLEASTTPRITPIDEPVDITEPLPNDAPTVAAKPPELLKRFPVVRDKPMHPKPPEPVKHEAPLAEKDVWRY